jgi:hypothetical protein
METALTSRTECGADHPRNQNCVLGLIARGGTHTKKISALLLIIGLLVAIIKSVVDYGDRTLSQWFG